jgi:hypothetical protein
MRVKQISGCFKHARIVIHDGHNRSSLLHESLAPQGHARLGLLAISPVNCTVTEIMPKETCPFGRGHRTRGTGPMSAAQDRKLSAPI